MKPAGAHVVFHRKLRARSGPGIRAVLLTKRTQDAPSDRGFWGLVGGQVDQSDKTPRKAVLREISEEIHVRSTFRLQPLRVVRRRKRGKAYEIAYFHAFLNDDMDVIRLKRNSKAGKKRDRKVEAEGLGWFTKPEIRRLAMRPEDRIAINEYFSLRAKR